MSSILEMYLGAETFKRIRKKIEEAITTPDSTPPPQGMMLLGFDGTYTRRIRTDSDGSLLVKTL